MILRVHGCSRVAIDADNAILVIEGVTHTEVVPDASVALDSPVRKIRSPDVRAAEDQPDADLSEPDEPVT